MKVREFNPPLVPPFEKMKKLEGGMKDTGCEVIPPSSPQSLDFFLVN